MTNVLLTTSKKNISRVLNMCPWVVTCGGGLLDTSSLLVTGDKSVCTTWEPKGDTLFVYFPQ